MPVPVEPVLFEELPQFLSECDFITEADRKLILEIRDLWMIDPDSNNLQLEEAARHHVNIDAKLGYIQSVLTEQEIAAEVEMDAQESGARDRAVEASMEMNSAGKLKPGPEWRVKDRYKQDEAYMEARLYYARVKRLNTHLSNWIFASGRRAEVLTTLTTKGR